MAARQVYRLARSNGQLPTSSFLNRSASSLAPSIANGLEVVSPIIVKAPPHAISPIEPDPQLDGLGYPRVANVSRQWRNPYAKWDDPQERCNIDEPLHAEEDMVGMWAPDVYKVSTGTALKAIGVAFSVLGGIVGLAYLSAPQRPIAHKSFPYDGLEREMGGFAGPAENREQE